jgi:hypothetical protein
VDVMLCVTPDVEVSLYMWVHDLDHGCMKRFYQESQ